MNIVARADWRARHPRSVSTIPTPTRDLWLHHLATDAWHGPAGVRACQNFHMDERGYVDVAYSFLVDTDGTVYEGRGPGAAGAHTQGRNSTSHGIAAMGNFETTDPPAPLLDAIARLVRHGHDRGWWPAGFTGGHRDVVQTACPGVRLYRRIPDINTAATATQEDDTMAITDDDLARIAGRVWGYQLLDGSSAGRRLAAIDQRTAKLLSRESAERTADELGVTADDVLDAMARRLAE